METKQKILITALDLFAIKGYEAVSVSDIASELNISKSALYKHYVNKRDIFDSIVEQIAYEGHSEEYEKITIDDVKNFTLAQFDYWTEDEFASRFRRMLVLEQYKDDEIRKLHKDCLTEGPVNYLKDIFAQLISDKLIVKENPEQLALEYYAPTYLAISIYDGTEDKEALNNMLNEHIERFFTKYRRKKR